MQVLSSVNGIRSQVVNGVRENLYNIKDSAMRQTVKQILKIALVMSEDNVLRIVNVMEGVGLHKNALRFVKKAFQEKHASVNLAKTVFSKLSKNCRAKLLNNLFINALTIGTMKRLRIGGQNYLTHIPFFFTISPSMKCNLKCVGCYAGNYVKEDVLTFEEIDRILKEAKELGIYFIVVSGGEPFVRRDLLEIFKKHNDMFFLVYTNGTLVNKELVKKLAELGNVAPAISVEGFERETDKRRGGGTYSKVLEAMKNLKEEGVLFGFSATPTRLNSDILSTDEFFDYYLDKGCSFGWFFQYIPIGRNPDVKLMAKPEQRAKLREKIDEIRNSRLIFIGDFWDDGPYVGGCIAGGREYFHINADGYVEPCVFTHFAVDNIKGKKLIEVINSDFFKAIRERQPYTDNLLLPCMIIDKPKVLREVCRKYNAKPTHEGADSIIHDKKIIKHLDKYSKRFEKISKKPWEERYSKIKHYNKV